jgi:ankyrin repeat protein
VRVIKSLVGCPYEEIILSRDGRPLCDFEPWHTLTGRRILCTFAVDDDTPQLLESGPYREGVEALSAIMNVPKKLEGMWVWYTATEPPPDVNVDFLLSEICFNYQRANGMTIHEAAAQGQIDVIRELKAKGINLSVINRSGNPPIHIAASKGHVPFIRALIDNGVSVSIRNEYGDSPIHAASKSGHVPAIEALLERGADVEAVDQDGRTPLLRAAQYDCEAAVRYLLGAGAKVHAGRLSALHVASSYGHVRIVTLLLQHGARTYGIDKEEETPLHKAASRGHDKVVECLLEWGANVGATNGHGTTAIHQAARYGHVEVVKVLMRGGGDIIAETRYGMTPLQCAAIGGQAEMVRFLCEMGCTGISRSICVLFGIKGLTEYF